MCFIKERDYLAIKGEGREYLFTQVEIPGSKGGTD